VTQIQVGVWILALSELTSEWRGLLFKRPQFWMKNTLQ
jgi:hypothetical protein